MGKASLARALASVMSAGSVAGVDLSDAREAHRAVVALRDAPAGHLLCERMRITVRVAPDPDVGLRVEGLTQALWSAVTLRYLQPVDGSSILALTDLARETADSMLKELSGEEKSALTSVGHAWACRSTLRNRPLSARESLLGM